MADSNQLLQRNKDHEATCAHEEARIIARHQVFVITCLEFEAAVVHHEAAPPGSSRAEAPRRLA